MRSCIIFSAETQPIAQLSSSIPLQFPAKLSEENTLPFFIEAILDSSQNCSTLPTTYDYNMWSKIPHVIAQKKRNSFENLSLFKQILSKSKLFKSEVSSSLFQSVSMGKSHICFADFKRFYEELDQNVSTQRFFHYFNKCNEFVLVKEHFTQHFTEFTRLFRKLLKSSNLILDCLFKRNSKLEDLKKDFLFLDYIKMIAVQKQEIFFQVF